MTPKTPKRQRATVEHLLPKSHCKRLGIKPANNKVTACYNCNSKKGSRTVEEFRQEFEAKSGSPVLFYGERAKTIQEQS